VTRQSDIRAQKSVESRRAVIYLDTMQTMTLPSHQDMYKAVLRHDAAFDGVFFTAVKTTGVFCRPTCTARTPRSENVEFFSTARAALLAGYRPCKRCRPMDMVGRPPQWVQRLGERIERDSSKRIRSNDLRSIGIDPSRASRWYKQHYGMTFQAYHRARRMGLALAAVRNGGDLNGVGHRNGYKSLSGFRDAFARTFGAPPGRAADTACLLARWMDTPLGPMLAIANDEGLCLLEFVDRRMLETQLATLRRRLGGAIVPAAGEHAHLDRLADELTRYFEGTLRRFTVPVVLRGTPFQVKTWKRLMDIPYGETLSYARMARDIGAPGAQRAVGKTNGDNRLAIIIPCHRVVRSDGTLCGYGGGLWRKKWLLEHEQQHVPALRKIAPSR
jgi:AraC family transcriptional regulator, regulatory protein of adaptative response / methylated-DNA-[protein]-cysteine methyltransferase